MPLTEKSRLILEQLVKGHSYEQILVQELAWTYQDIFRAVEEVLALIDTGALPASHSDRNSQPTASYDERMQGIRQKYRRAYEKWTDEEDERLRAEFRSGKRVKELAGIFQRQPGAIRSRLDKLGCLA